MMTSAFWRRQNARGAPEWSAAGGGVGRVLLRALAVTPVEQLAGRAQLAAVRLLDAEGAADVVHAVLIGSGHAAAGTLVAHRRVAHRARVDVARLQARVAAVSRVGAVRGGQRYHAGAHRL